MNSGTADAQRSEPPSQARTGSNASRIALDSTDNNDRSRAVDKRFENPFQFNSFGGLWQVCCDLDELGA